MNPMPDLIPNGGRDVHKNISFESHKQRKQKTDRQVSVFDTGCGGDELSGTGGSSRGDKLL